MKNNESATDILLNLNLSQINEIVNFSASLAEGELNISNTVDVISNGFFSAFYNTASYYVNCALEHMTPWGVFVVIFVKIPVKTKSITMVINSL